MSCRTVYGLKLIDTQQLFCICSEKVANDQIAQPGMCVLFPAITSGIPFGLVCVCFVPYSPLVGDWLKGNGTWPFMSWKTEEDKICKIAFTRRPLPELVFPGENDS